jgi:hypothetical protein
MIYCPKCRRDISTMENLIKPNKFKWTCKCGKDVTKQKLNQLLDVLADNYRQNFQEV